MASAAAATGASFLPWQQGLNRPDHQPENAPYPEWELRRPTALVREMIAHLIVDPAAGYAADAAAAIRTTKPDLVLTSFFAFGAMLAAEAAGAPFDVLMPNIYPLPAPGMPPFGLGLSPAHGPLGYSRDRVLGAMSQRMWDTAALPGLNEVRGTHGLGPISHYQDQVTRARRQLLLTSAAFDFRADLPSNARYVGPVLDDPAWASADWQSPAGHDPLVLVSMSTTYQNQQASLQRVVDALATLPVRALVTTGPVIDPATIVAVPNVTVVSTAPHATVLQEAALVITHGGHGTLMKALAAGVPAVVMPHGRDQADNAARVKHRGAGRSVSRTAAPAKISPRPFATSSRTAPTDAPPSSSARPCAATLRAACSSMKSRASLLPRHDRRSLTRRRQPQRLASRARRWAFSANLDTASLAPAVQHVFDPARRAVMIRLGGLTWLVYDQRRGRPAPTPGGGSTGSPSTSSPAPTIPTRDRAADGSTPRGLASIWVVACPGPAAPDRGLRR